MLIAFELIPPIIFPFSKIAAFTVVFPVILRGPEYSSEPGKGSDPSVVYLISGEGCSDAISSMMSPDASSYEAYMSTRYEPRE
ncbi:MAG: hypothetical protein BWY89_00609 [Bacteroidetes bacterium ADurb.BinA012]|nr:MAG: hypothetical protein BWY89_00609 [Bacteroidetes bacterium ADurb.BinA012]